MRSPALSSRAETLDGLDRALDFFVGETLEYNPWLCVWPAIRPRPAHPDNYLRVYLNVPAGAAGIRYTGDHLGQTGSWIAMTSRPVLGVRLCWDYQNGSSVCQAEEKMPRSFGSCVRLAPARGRPAAGATRMGRTRRALHIDIADQGPQQTVMSAGFQVRAEAAGLRRETAEVELGSPKPLPPATQRPLSKLLAKPTRAVNN
jgi:hypothetical protein